MCAVSAYVRMFLDASYFLFKAADATWRGKGERFEK